MGKMIIIADIDCMNDEQYDETINLLKQLPINYQIWET